MKLSRLIPALAFAACLNVQAADNTQKITTLVKVDNFDVTNMHMAIFAAQNPAGDDPEHQIALLNELVNTFMVANSAEGRELANNAEIASAIAVANARLIAQALVRDHLANAEVSDAQVEAAYKAKYEGVSGQEFKARHILLETEDEAKAVIGELDGGADFAELAKAKSTGPSGAVGGDLGWFSPDQMVQPFSEALATMQNGKHSSAPVKTQFGWHVILREDSREVPAPALAEVRDELLKQIRTESLGALIRDIRERTKIEVVESDAQVAE